MAIENENLANALTVLPDDKRDIVLLAYFLDMTDQEIADKLDMVRRTVQYKRAQSLKELKKEMEVTEDGAQSDVYKRQRPLRLRHRTAPASRSPTASSSRMITESVTIRKKSHIPQRSV